MPFQLGYSTFCMSLVDFTIFYAYKPLLPISYFWSSVAGKESLTAMATEAAQKALQMAEVEPNDVDLVLLCTSTPEDLFGSAPQVMFPVILCNAVFSSFSFHYSFIYDFALLFGIFILQHIKAL